jgi:hypothetical protein
MGTAADPNQAAKGREFYDLLNSRFSSLDHGNFCD